MMGVITFVPAQADDFERLCALRIAVMREHLERLGRFDPARARARFVEGFSPAHTRLIHVDGVFAGCVTLKPATGGVELEHFYIEAERQGQGIGGAVLDRLLGETDAAGQSVGLGVLKQSPARRFYERRGFDFTHSGEWDDCFARAPGR